MDPGDTERKGGGWVGEGGEEEKLTIVTFAEYKCCNIGHRIGDEDFPVGFRG